MGNSTLPKLGTSLEISIRQGTAEDAATISDMANTIWPVCYKDVLTVEQISNMLEKIYSLSSLKEQMSEGHTFWIASENDRDVGFISAYTENETMWLKKLYIQPEMQGKGCGRRLIDVAIEHFKPFRNISLYVNRENVKAQAYYKHLGFSVTAEVPVQMGDYHFIDFIMSKETL